MKHRGGYQLGFKKEQASTVSTLSKRELEILWMISEGHDSEEIALLLGIQSRTVRNHTSRLLSKMQAKNRAHAAARAISKGWGEEILDAISKI